MANATSGMTTIRQNTTWTVHHNNFLKDLARCSIFDFSDHKIVSHESVINYGHYEFIYYQGISLLEPVSLTKSGTVTAENHNPLVFDSIEYNNGLM